jgi:predicted nucleic acid-binding protein
MADPARLVFDVHLYVNNILGPDARWPVVAPVPPGSGNPSADSLAIVFDDPAGFVLYASPHIIRNTARVLVAHGLDRALVAKYLAAVQEIISDSGGDIRDPGQVLDLGSPDFEDNHILSLALAVDADLIVSDDVGLTALSPWRGRPVIRPREFVQRFARSRRQ